MIRDTQIQFIKALLLTLVILNIVSCTNDYINYFLYQFPQEGIPVVNEDNIKYYDYTDFLLIGNDESIYYYFDKKTFNVEYITGYSKKYHKKIIKEINVLYKKYNEFTGGDSNINIINFDITGDKIVIKYYKYDKLLTFK